MSDVKKEPQTVADYVSGLKREPLDTGPGGYFFPLVPALFFAIVIGLGSCALYMLTVLLTGLFWMEDLSAYLFDTDRMNMLGRNLCRYLVIQSVVIVAVGCVLVALQRRREFMS